MDALAQHSLSMTASAADDVVRSVDAALNELWSEKRDIQQNTFRAFPQSIVGANDNIISPDGITGQVDMYNASHTTI